ncbi:AraC family transcriptional regulator [Spirilliplanes yamanashiensis]|uniref:AraC family transcriptional regulator n=2 Tax=Spirilliplanes yamanashiensis TaxID=42233 RepID=A0A8J4DGH8_9ACTN|nr:AraC family transcriptional regulator [Spirilliplanes yamanashiensis]
MRDGTTRVGPVAGAEPSFHRFADLDATRASEMLRRFYSPVEIGVAEDAGPCRMSSSVLRLGPLTVGQLSFGPETRLDAEAVAGYHVTLPLAGELWTRHSDTSVVALPARSAAVFRAGHPVESLHTAGMSELDVKIEQGALEDELEALIERRVQGTIDLAAAMDVSSGPGRTWAQLMRLLRDEGQDGTGLIYQPLIADRLWRSVLTGLLMAVPHRYSDALARPVRPGPPRAIRRVADAIQAEPHRPFTVRELAELGGMSVRSLQEGFRRHLGATPMSYLQQVRLARSHEALLHADPQCTTVAAIAHRWGFTHLGRFAQAYRVRYGVHPSASLRADR